MNLSPATSRVVKHRTGFSLLRPLSFPALGLGLVSLVAWATPPFDPICGSPNSRDLVLAIRAERAAAAQARRGTIRLQGPEAQPQLSFERPDRFDLPRLILPGAAGRTYAREIAPILHDYCAKCHRSDGVAPFALTNHSVAEAWAPSIKHALRSGKMPPWHADPEYGRFANDLSLPGHLKSALIRWLDAGASRGDGADPLAELASPPAFARWPEDLGEPDALVTALRRPGPRRVRSNSTDSTRTCTCAASG